MTGAAWAQLAVLVGILILTVPLLARFVFAAVEGETAEPQPGSPDTATGQPSHSGQPSHTGQPGQPGQPRGGRLIGVARSIENRVYKLLGVNPDVEQGWRAYAVSLLVFSAVSIVVVYLMLRLQGVLPLNPDGKGAVSPFVAFNTAVSFVTNTNWQAYSGEVTMSNGSQMLALAVQNFVSAAAGIAIALAITRGIVRRGSATLGNFWVDMTRVVVRILLPLSLLAALVLMSQGVVQNFSGTKVVSTLAGATQAIPGGPAASQIAIKMFGSNGGGFFNANAVHPFENPNGWSNLFQMWLMLALPFSLPLVYGRFVGNRRQGHVLLATMVVLWGASVAAASFAETRNDSVAVEAAAPTVGAGNAGDGVGSTSGSMEGKDVRFGPATCAVWAVSTTGTSNGSVNCAHDSLNSAAGGVALGNMLLGEVSPGGVGVGLMGILIYALLAVFIAGLMVGRTPEYLGKKVQAPEVKLAVIYTVAMPLTVLVLAGIAVRVATVTSGLSNSGPHGLSEVLYAFASAGNNNGSAFGGVPSASGVLALTQSVAMLIGRFGLIIPALALGGSLGRKRVVAATAGTMPTDTPLFVGLLTGVVVIVAGLTFFPALALGPIAEYFT